MPSASEELRAKFPGSDQEAIGVLRKHFVAQKFVWRKIDPKYKPTQREWDAINYLFHEWDWGYEETNDPPPSEQLEKGGAT
jgi:hypothetical protein